jgi:hypothetical protein
VSWRFEQVQKRRVQRLRPYEQLEQEAEATKIWYPKKKANKPRASADINMVFFLPTEYQNRSDGENEEEVVAHLVLHPQQAHFDKPDMTTHIIKSMD